MSDVIKEAYKSVYDFNKIANNFDKVDKDSIALQLDLIQEEYLECVKAYDEEDNIELLDGACDTLVVVFGLLQKLSVAGFDVATAMQRVNESNMSKYVPKGKPLQYDSSFYVTFNEEYEVFVVKDINGKIRKPKSFVPVDVSDLVPPHFFKEA